MHKLVQKTHWTCPSIAVILRSKAVALWPLLEDLSWSLFPWGAISLLPFATWFAFLLPSGLSRASTGRPFPARMDLRCPATLTLQAKTAGLCSVARKVQGDLSWLRVLRVLHRPWFGHTLGAFHAPGGSSLFCFGSAALRVTVSLEIFFANRREKISRDPPVNAELRHLGAWPARSPVPRPKGGANSNRRTTICTRTKSP